MTKEQIRDYVKRKKFIQDVINKDFYYSDRASVDLSHKEFLRVTNNGYGSLRYENVTKEMLSVLLRKPWEKKRKRKRKAKKKKTKLQLCNEILINNCMSIIS